MIGSSGSDMPGVHITGYRPVSTSQPMEELSLKDLKGRMNVYLQDMRFCPRNGMSIQYVKFISKKLNICNNEFWEFEYK